MRKTRFHYLLYILFTAAGCTFDTSGIAGPGDGGVQAPDAELPAIEDVFHVPAAAETGGGSDLFLQNGDVLDTSALTLNGGPVPGGVEFDAWPQDDPLGPELAIVHVRHLQVDEGAVVRVTGERPLVVLAAGAVILYGVLDASARRAQPGPGGAGPGQGVGAGLAGEHRGAQRDAGGGGAGHATAGGKGGDAECVASVCDPLALGGRGGEAYGERDVTMLRGGSGGGAGAPGCGPAAGAGGGAIQIYAALSITIAAGGGIDAGGGGGGGGMQCVDANGPEVAAGSGGGSGGVIVVQSRVIEHDGVIAANGGGGGGGAGWTTERLDELEVGVAGSEGARAAMPAAGGRGATVHGAHGGAGGALGSAPQAGATALGPPRNRGNAGGGGGAAGYIVVSRSSAYRGAGEISPAALHTSY